MVALHAMLVTAVLILAVRTQGAKDQACLACTSGNADWKESECRRFELLQKGQIAGRYGHASVVFPYQGQLALWLIGGRGKSYAKWNFQTTERRADIWYSVDGVKWEQVTAIGGDFSARSDAAFLVEDVKHPGEIAPFWERYGHTLDVVLASNATHEYGLMVLSGGFSPQPSNDVWVSEDGIHWYLVGYAPWSGRGYHASAYFQGRLFIMGGSPLSNEVWSGQINKTFETNTFRMDWIQHGEAVGLNPTEWSLNQAMYRWSPRAGAALAVQHSLSHDSRLILTGGYAAWPCTGRGVCHPSYNSEERSLNDVWTSYDGTNWTLLTAAAPFPARAWHSLTPFTDLSDPRYDVSLAATKAKLGPKLWLAGGGYVGSQQNNIVHNIDAYADLWWTRDGIQWTRVSRTANTREHACSSIDAYETNTLFLGKYGHQMIPFWQILTDQNVCTHNDECVTAAEVRIPALYFIAGDFGYSSIHDPEPSSEVYASRAALLCEIDGHRCPYPQHIVKLTDSTARVVAAAYGTKTRAGMCPDPQSDCPDNLDTCRDSDQQLTFYLVHNSTTNPHLNDDHLATQAYTVYNASQGQHHPESFLGFYSNVLSSASDQDKIQAGYVARLPGCHCETKEEDGRVVGYYQGEFCEEFILKDSARRGASPPLFFIGILVLASSSSLSSSLLILRRR